MFHSLIANGLAPFLTILAIAVMSFLTVRTWKNNQFRLRLLLFWAVLVLSIFSGLFCIHWASETTKSTLEYRLADLARIMTADIEGMDHASITLETPLDDPTYQRIMNRMKEWMKRVPSIASVYTIRLDEKGQYYFIADPATDLNRDGILDEKEADLPIGTPYDDVFAEVPEFADAFEGRSGFNQEPAEDFFGVWITAAEPLYNEQGEIEAILGVDFWGEKWAEELNASKLWPSLFYLAFLALFFSVQLFLINHQNAEQKLKQNAAKLEQSIEMLVQANLKADFAAKAKDEFLANMSHEIRTPMNAILGMIHLVQKTQLSEKQFFYIENAEQSTKLLLRVINDILDFSKIEAGKLEIENVVFSLRKTLSELYGLLSNSAHKKNLEFVFNVSDDIPEYVLGDSVRLSQVIMNLISNAVKFTETGKIEMTIRMIDENEKNVKLLFSVQDTGIGMSPEHVQKLFAPFSQADTSTTRKYGGTGLGLVISKRLVEMMRGEIGCESKYGKGSCFHFTARFGRCNVPEGTVLEGFHTQDKETLANDYKDDSGFHRRKSRVRILMAEDNKINQMVAVELLTLDGFTVDVAENGRIALEKLEENHYDLVLMDIQMPEMDGLEATRIIRSNPKYVKLPILAMTAHAMSGDHEKSIAAGMNDHITKPIDPTALYQTIAKWIMHD